MDASTLTQLLNSTNSGTGISPLPDFNAIMKSLEPFLIALTVVSVLITVLYLFSVINKWRANKAIIDIKKIVIEMNERDKLRMAQAVMTPAPMIRDNEQPSAVEATLPLTQ